MVLGRFVWSVAVMMGFLDFTLPIPILPIVERVVAFVLGFFGGVFSGGHWAVSCVAVASKASPLGAQLTFKRFHY